MGGCISVSWKSGGYDVSGELTDSLTERQQWIVRDSWELLAADVGTEEWTEKLDRHLMKKKDLRRIFARIMTSMNKHHEDLASFIDNSRTLMTSFNDLRLASGSPASRQQQRQLDVHSQFASSVTSSVMTTSSDESDIHTERVEDFDEESAYAVHGTVAADVRPAPGQRENYPSVIHELPENSLHMAEEHDDCRHNLSESPSQFLLEPGVAMSKLYYKTETVMTIPSMPAVNRGNPRGRPNLKNSNLVRRTSSSDDCGDVREKRRASSAAAATNHRCDITVTTPSFDYVDTDVGVMTSCLSLDSPRRRRHGSVRMTSFVDDASPNTNVARVGDCQPSSSPQAGGDCAEAMRRHTRLVLETLGAAAECLDMEDTTMLSSLLVALGQMHAPFRVRAHHLTRFWSVVRFLLRESLGVEAFTPEVENTWMIVFTFVVGRMREGLRLQEQLEGEAELEGESDVSFIMDTS